MKFEEILPDLRNGKSFRRKRDTYKGGYYFIKFENNTIGWYDRDKESTMYLYSELKSSHILSEDWEIADTEV